MNQLQHETSPYLLQHAHNPVHWYAWREEAFKRAREEDKPILVSIGYSTCHWCHVMERESFENEEVAAFMNEHFINIKVDREERPDVDQIYMEACQAISGSGGWPLNCFLTPDKKPFFAGTYFPPRPAHQRASWIQVLQNIYRAFTQKRQEVEDQADRLLKAIARSGGFMVDNAFAELSGEAVFNRVTVDNLFHHFKERFDTQEGGFGSAPKFPGTMGLRWLLRYHYHTGQEEALQHVLHSLDKMIHGGIYDQLGGGFARYATDRAWLVPHFEKMLYDNALLVVVLAEAWQCTGNDRYRETIEETLAFIEREMRAPDGGFYAALDADSEGVEGKFYVWSKTEIEEILDEKSEHFLAFYDVSEGGNWEGHNILNRPQAYEVYAKMQDLDLAAFKSELQASREKLMVERAKRIRPGLDDKQILSWNALMITAYASAYAALGVEAYRQTCLESLEGLLERFQNPTDGTFFHTYKAGRAQYPAFLEDYAFLIEALLAAHQISYDNRYLEKARQILDLVFAKFSQPEGALFYYTPEGQEDIPIRSTEVYDSALPSGNSTMVQNLRQLGLLLDRPDYSERAEAMLKGMKNAVERYPTSFARWAWSILDYVFAPVEIAILGEAASTLADQVQQQYLPGKLLMASAVTNEEFPLLKGKPIEKDTYIYVCRQYSCQTPVNTLSEFKQLIEAQRSY